MATYSWNVTSGSFSLAGSWYDVSTGAPASTAPGPDDDAYFGGNGGTVAGNGSVQGIFIDAGVSALWTFSGQITADTGNFSSVAQFSAGASLTITGVANSTYSPYGLTVNAPTTFTDASLNSAGATLTVGGNYNLTGSPGPDLTLEADSAATTLDATIGNGTSGMLTVTGGSTFTAVVNAPLSPNYSTGLVILGQSNTYDGVTTDGSGVLAVSDDGVVAADGGLSIGNGQGSTGIATVESGGSLEAGGTGTSIGYLAGSTGSLTVDGDGSTFTNDGYLTVGNAGDGTLTVSDDAAATASEGVSVGSASGGMGSVTVESGGTFSAGSLSLAQAGIGSLAVEDGGSLQTAGPYDSIGSGGVGTVTVTGSGSTWDSAGQIGVGVSGQGTLVVSDDASVTAADGGGIAEDSGSTGLLEVESGGTLTTGGTFDGIGGSGADGTVIVTGTGSTWTASGTLAIGQAGLGTLAVSNGGKVTTSASIYVGDDSGGTGVVTVADGTLNFALALLVGNQAGGYGTVNVLAGGDLIATGPSVSPITTYADIGDQTGAIGAVNVSGTGAVLNLTGNQLAVGSYGFGTLTIDQGGSVITGTANSTATAALAVGRYAGSEGTVTVDGSGSSLTVVGYGYIGRGGSGKLTVSDSAIVTVGDAADRLDIGGGGAGVTTGSVNTAGDGQLLVTSDGVLDAVEELVFGNNGVTGEGEVDDGGVIEAGGQIGIGDGSSTYGAGSGTVTVGAGGTLKAAQTAGAVPSGKSGIYLGDYGTSIGTLNVEGTGALVDANGTRINIGNISVGYMTVSEGATARSGSTGTTYPALTLGYDAGAAGTLTIADAGSTFTAAGQAIVGLGGQGHLLVEAAGALTTGSTSASASSGFIIADSAGSTGDATVTGTGSTISNSGSFIVGDAGVGSLVIDDGAGVTTTGATGDGADIGLAAGSTGSFVTVDGTGSTWSAAGSLEIGVGGTGTLNIEDGGQVTATNVDVGAGAGETGVLTLTTSDAPSSTAPATLLTVTNNLTVGVDGYGTLILGANTSVAVTNDFTLGIEGSVYGDANLDPNLTTISGGYYATGTLTSKQVVVTSTGVIAPSGGTLTINGAVDGTGTIDVGGGDGIVFDGAVNKGQGDGLTIAFTGPGATINWKTRPRSERSYRVTLLVTPSTWAGSPASPRRPTSRPMATRRSPMPME